MLERWIIKWTCRLLVSLLVWQGLVLIKEYDRHANGIETAMSPKRAR